MAVRCGDSSRFSSIVSFHARVSSADGGSDPSIPRPFRPHPARPAGWRSSSIPDCGRISGLEYPCPRMFCAPDAGRDSSLPGARDCSRTRPPAKGACPSSRRFIRMTSSSLSCGFSSSPEEEPRFPLSGGGWPPLSGITSRVCRTGIRSIPCSFPFRFIGHGRSPGAIIRRRFSPVRSPDGLGSISIREFSRESGTRRASRRSIGKGAPGTCAELSVSTGGHAPRAEISSWWTISSRRGRPRGRVSPPWGAPPPARSPCLRRGAQETDFPCGCGPGRPRVPIRKGGHLPLDRRMAAVGTWRCSGEVTGPAKREE